MAYEHQEMIIDYATDGTDFWYNDNRGSLVRCKDCMHFLTAEEWGGEDNACDRMVIDGKGVLLQTEPNGYCHRGERKDVPRPERRTR